MLDGDFSGRSTSILGNISDFSEEKLDEFEGDLVAREPKNDDEDGEKGVAKFLQYAEAGSIYISSLFANLRSTQLSHF